MKRKMNSVPLRSLYLLFRVIIKQQHSLPPTINQFRGDVT